MLTLVPNVVPRRAVIVDRLGGLDGKRSAARPNFPANRDYQDLRSFSLADLGASLEEERADYTPLAATGYAQAA